MAVTKKTGFELEQLVARQVYSALKKLPDFHAQVRALDHVRSSLGSEYSDRRLNELQASMPESPFRGPEQVQQGAQEGRQIGIPGVGSISRI